MAIKEYYYSDSSYQLELNLQEKRRALIKLLEDSENGECLSCPSLKCRCQDKTSSISVSSLSSNEKGSVSTGNATKSIKSVEKKSVDMDKTEVREIDDKDDEKVCSSSPEHDHNQKETEAWVTSLNNVEIIAVTKRYPVSEQIKDSVNFSWPPAPKSVWNENKKREAKLKEFNNLINHLVTAKGTSVQAFFRAFHSRSNVSSPVHAAYVRSANDYLTSTYVNQQLPLLMNKIKMATSSKKTTEYSYF